MEKIVGRAPTQNSGQRANVLAVTRWDGFTTMKFLLKVGFWLSIVVLLLPTPTEKSASTPQISTAEAVGAASAALSDARDFCSRQPNACEVGSHAITTFGQKAQAAAKMLYEFLTDKFGSERTGSVGVKGNGSQNTLTPNDLSPRWRGPGQDGKNPT